MEQKRIISLNTAVRPSQVEHVVVIGCSRVFFKGGQKEKAEERQGEGERKREKCSDKRHSKEEETNDVAHHHGAEIQTGDQVPLTAFVLLFQPENV